MKKYIVKYQFKNEKTIYHINCNTLEKAKAKLKQVIAENKQYLKGVAIYETL